MSLTNLLSFDSSLVFSYSEHMIDESTLENPPNKPTPANPGRRRFLRASLIGGIAMGINAILGKKTIDTIAAIPEIKPNKTPEIVPVVELVTNPKEIQAFRNVIEDIVNLEEQVQLKEILNRLGNTRSDVKLVVTRYQGKNFAGGSTGKIYDLLVTSEDEDNLYRIKNGGKSMIEMTKQSGKDGSGRESVNFNINQQGKIVPASSEMRQIDDSTLKILVPKLFRNPPPIWRLSPDQIGIIADSVLDRSTELESRQVSSYTITNGGWCSVTTSIEAP